MADECAQTDGSQTMDVILCTHNRAGMLADCLGSLEQQGLARNRWGVQVVLNACTDDSEAVVDAARSRGRLPAVTILREPKPGLVRARVRALSAGTATWVLMLDDDALLDPDWLEQAMAFLADRPRVGVLGGRQEVVWLGDPSPAALERPEAFAAQDCGDVPRKVALQDPRGLVGSALLFRRAALMNSAWARHRLLRGHSGREVTSGDDTEMFVRVLQAGFEGWYLPALRLRHLIPAARTDLNHLGRLYRGYAATRVIMAALIPSQRPGAARLAATLARHVLRCWRYSLAETIRHPLGGGRTPQSYLRACVRKGRVDGALTLLRNRTRL